MVSTHLKNISHIGSFPQGSGWKFSKYLKSLLRPQMVRNSIFHHFNWTQKVHFGNLEPVDLQLPSGTSLGITDLKGINQQVTIPGPQAIAKYSSGGGLRWANWHAATCMPKKKTAQKAGEKRTTTGLAPNGVVGSLP